MFVDKEMDAVRTLIPSILIETIREYYFSNLVKSVWLAGNVFYFIYRVFPIRVCNT